MSLPTLENVEPLNQLKTFSVVEKPRNAGAHHFSLFFAEIFRASCLFCYSEHPCVYYIVCTVSGSWVFRPPWERVLTQEKYLMKCSSRHAHVC